MGDNNRYFAEFTRSLREETGDDNPENFIYYGGDTGRHLNYWDLHTRGQIESPPRQDTCLCGHHIQEQCYIKHKDSGKILICGNCCIKRYIPAANRQRMCSVCKQPHKNKKNNLCNECREDHLHECTNCRRFFKNPWVKSEEECICWTCREKPCEGGCGKLTDLGIKCPECKFQHFNCKCCKANNTSNSSGFCTNCENTRKRKCKTCKTNSHLLKWKCCYQCYIKDRPF